MAGSFVNRLMEGSQQPTPVVGMGVTRCGWTDRHPFTVVEVVSKCKIVVQEDNAVRVDSNGMSESQSYEYSPNPEGAKYTLTFRRDGKWREAGTEKGGTGWMVGERVKYHDYSF